MTPRRGVGVGIAVIALIAGAAGAGPPPAAPGRIVVRYRDTLTAPADVAFRSGRGLAGATRDRSDSLDRLNAELGVVQIRPVAPRARRLGAPVRAGARAAAARARFSSRARRAVAAAVPDVDGWYVLDLAADTDVHAAAARYARDSHVLHAEPDYLVRANAVPLPAVPAIPDDAYVHVPGSGAWREGMFLQAYPDLWGLQRTRTIEAWNRFASPFTAGAGVLVAVVDTGLDPMHPDIAGAPWVNTGEIGGNAVDDDGNGFVDDVTGWDFTTTLGNCEPFGPKPPDADPFDDHGHGTHVSGTIAARANNGIGIAGVAPGATILPLKVLDAGGCGFSSAIAAALVYASDEGADVVNLSLGGPASAIEEDALAYAHAMGLVLVASAGNSHADTAAPLRLSPADSVHVITVAATDELDQPTSFSNYGQKIDVAAPGGGDPLSPPDPPAWNVLSLLSSGAPPFSVNDVAFRIVTPDHLYLRLGGTSMAAPHVSGLAALLLARNPAFSNEEVRQTIRIAAVDATATAGFDAETGTGRIDADGAVAGEPVLTAFLDEPAGGPAQVPIAFHGTAAGPAFARWEILVGVGLEPQVLTPVAAATTPVNDGEFFVWNPNEGQYPEGRYSVVLRATDAAGRIFEARHAITLTHHSLPGWPIADALVPTIVAVGDTHPAAGAEVVAAGNFSVQRWTAGGGRLSDVTSTGEVRWLPTLADLDGDGRLETLIGTADGLQVVNGDAVTMIGTDPLGPMLSGAATPVVVDDMDGDGQPEIVTLDVTGRVTVRDRTGAVRPGWPQQPFPPLPPFTGVVNTDMAVGDIDGDGAKDIVLGLLNSFGEPFRLLALGLDGTLLWSREMVPGQPPGPVIIGLNDVVLGDVDDDGDLEVVFATRDYTGNHFFILDGGGLVVRDWLVPFDEVNIGTTPAPEVIQGPHPILVDLDDDGDLEIVVGASTLESFRPLVYAWHHDGTLVGGFPSEITLEEGHPVSDHLVAGDLDGDGTTDLVSGASSGSPGRGGPRLHAWSASGALLPGWPKTLVGVSSFGSSSSLHLPTLADVDGDGRLDLVAVLDMNQITARTLGVPVSERTLQWPEFRHDLGRTGRYERPRCGNGTIDPEEECDDGNGVSCDGCSGRCTLDGLPVCGDGVESLCGEECDDGNVASGDGCDANCTRTACGNGVVTAGEECDDGDTDAFDGCTGACTLCGNGVVSAPEECDDGNADTFDGCTSACTVCGNNIVSVPEACDDGNRLPQDCCTGACTTEPVEAPCRDDANPCTTDICVNGIGCRHRPNPVACGYSDAAFDVGIPTTRLTMRDPTGSETSRRLSFKGIDGTGQGRIFVPQRFTTLDPTQEGGVLRVFRPGPFGDSWSALLPPGGWHAIGSGDPPAGYRYASPNRSPSIVVVLRAGRLTVKVKGVGFTYDLDESAQGRLALGLTLGTSTAGGSFEMCAEARPRPRGTPPSTAANDRVGRFLAGASPSPAACPAY